MDFGRRPFGRPFESEGNAFDTALVCQNGHRLTGHAEDYSQMPRHCDRCGALTMVQCPNCNAPIPGDAPGHAIMGDVAPPSYCGGCGQPYPWRAAALERLRRVARMQAELHSLDATTTDELNTFVTDVVENRATAEQANTFGKWFTKKAGVESAKAIGAVLKDVATGVIAEAIKGTMMPH